MPAPETETVAAVAAPAPVHDLTLGDGPTHDLTLGGGPTHDLTLGGGSVHGVTLGGGAILLLPHPVTDTGRAEIAAAAAPLMSLLESRGLIDGRTP